MSPSLFRFHPCHTLTHRSIYTLRPSKRSILARAPTPTARIPRPALPDQHPLLGLALDVQCDGDIDGILVFANSSTRTATEYGISWRKFSNTVSRTIS